MIIGLLIIKWFINISIFLKKLIILLVVQYLKFKFLIAFINLKDINP